MSNFSNYMADAIVDSTLRGVAYIPTTVYIALLTDAAATDEVQITALENGDMTNEVSISGTDYVRKIASFIAPADGATSNTGAITFDTAIAVWGNIRWVAIMDAVSSGNVLYYGKLTVDKQINTNDTFIFNLGDLDVTVD